MSEMAITRNVVPFESASELRNGHANLIKQLERHLAEEGAEKNKSAALAQLEPQIRQFLERGAATGVYLDQIEERTACQVLLDYWVSSLTRAGRPVPEALLDQFDEKRLPILTVDCPYAGLEAFRDKTYFFGRECETKELLSKIREAPMVLVLGSSGSGKSSLVLGGVLPALREPDATPKLTIAPDFVPGDAVLQNLAEAVRGKDSSGAAVDDAAFLRQDPTHLYAIAGGAKASATLITIDQFEEVFTLSDSLDRDALVKNLSEFLERGRELGHRVILTMRAEFEDEINKLLAQSKYLDKNKTWKKMDAMGYEALRTAIEKPAAAVNLQFKAGIVDDLARKVFNQPAALPLLQFTLKALWERRKRNRITQDVYEEVGDPIKALERWADAFYGSQILETRREIERILLELVRVNEKAETYRQPVLKGRLLQGGVAKTKTEEVIELLRNEGFVRVTRSASGGDDVIEVKHESLIRNWPKYVEWINEKRRRLPLTKAAEKWAEIKKVDEEQARQLLYTESQAQEWTGQKDLPDLETAFVHESINEAERIQREKEAARRNVWLSWSFGLTALFLICGWLIYYYLYQRPYPVYYNSYVKVNGIPIGIGQLKRFQYKARSSSLRIFKKGRLGKEPEDVLSMEAVNGSGELTPVHDVGTYFEPSPEQIYASRECKWVYNRAKGRLMYEEAYNKFGEKVWVLIYSPPTGKQQRFRDALYLTEKQTGDMGAVTPGTSTVANTDTAGLKTERPYETGKGKVESATPQSKGPTGAVDPPSGKKTARLGQKIDSGRDTERSFMPFILSEAKIVSIEYSEQGYDGRVRYFDGNRNRISGPDHAYGRQYVYGDPKCKGCITRMISLDRADEWMNDDEGNAVLECDFDQLGNVTRAMAYDAGNRVTMLKRGFALSKYEYDQKGRLIKGEYFDSQDKPIRIGGSHQKFRFEYDPRGNRAAESYFGEKGEPVLLKDGFHKVTGKYEGGNRTEWAYFGVKGEPVLLKDGFHKVTGKYEGGNRTEWAYFGVKGEPVLLKDGFHKVKGKYDDDGNQIEWAYFGCPYAKGADVEVLYRGYHKVTGRYDNRNRIEWAYFGTKGEPILHKEGYHKTTGTYDNRDNRIEWAYFGTKGEPIPYKDGYHKETGTYDNRGNRIEWAYFGTKGEPILHKEGYHKTTGTYDNRGNRIEWAYFGTKGEPILHKEGYHKTTGTYDNRDNRIEWAYFGTKGEPILHKDGYHKETGRYDNRDNRIGWAYFGVKGEPILHKDGYHKLTGEYDERGNRIAETYFGRDEPAMNRYGYARLSQTFGANGELLEMRTLDTRGKLVVNNAGFARAVKKYDKSGNLIEVTATDEAGKLIVAEHGYARMAMRYDARGHLIEEAYFGADDRPIILKDVGCARVTNRYDLNGNQTEECCFNEQNVLDGDLHGYAKAIRKFDASSKMTEERYYGPDGKPTRLDGDFQHVTKCSYDARGNKVEELYTGLNGEKVQGYSVDANDFCYRWTAKYDATGKRTEAKCHSK